MSLHRQWAEHHFPVAIAAHCKGKPEPTFEEAYELLCVLDGSPPDQQRRLLGGRFADLNRYMAERGIESAVVVLAAGYRRVAAEEKA